jgi:alkylated DNA repair dioxygenase AlkB
MGKRRRILGCPGGGGGDDDDVRFHLEKDAMGVPGFHVAVNVFHPAVHRRLFEGREAFERHAQPFVTEQATPIQQTILHPAGRRAWPPDWHRVINAVRDCGLFGPATVPDCAYGLTYRPGSSFPCHWDGRGKWGEYVVVATLGAPCTITFQHCAPRRTPVDPARPWDWIPPDPDDKAMSDGDGDGDGGDANQNNPYWTRSRTAEEVALGGARRRLWQLTMTLPPNSLYVMSGPSRYDWRHGINCDPANHPVPPPASTYISAGGAATRRAADGWLYPPWNPSRARRAVVYRSTKCFGDLCLQEERDRACAARDVAALTAVNARIDAAHRFRPQDEDARRELTEEEVERRHAEGRALLEELQRTGVHRLRFDGSEVLFESDGPTRAAGDVVDEGNRGDGGDEKKDDDDDIVESNVVAFSGRGHRLGQSWEGKAAAPGGRGRPTAPSLPEVIDLLDSDEEEKDGDDGQDVKPAVSAAEPNVRMSYAGRAALFRLDTSAKNGSKGAPAAAAAAANASSSIANASVSWQCPRCALINKSSALRCLCGTERLVNDAPEINAGPVNQPAALIIDRGGTMANQSSVPTQASLAHASGGGGSGSGLAPGHVLSLRDKHAYLHSGSDGGGASITDSSKRQRPNGDDEQDCFLVGSLLVDQNPGAYSSGGWIWTHCKNFASMHPGQSRVDTGNIKRYRNEFWEKYDKTLTARKTHELIGELARKHNVLHGKWLLNVKPESAQDIWPKIRSACIAGKLGSTAKISDRPENGTFVICSYTNNFTDKKDVLRVRRAIHELGMFAKSALHYKPDAITLLDIYSGDMKGMRTTVYSCGGGATKDRLEDYDCECLVESYTKCTRAPGCPRCYPKCKGLGGDAMK